MSEKQISRVLKSLESGAEFSCEVAQSAGLPLPIASAYLTVLCREGLVRLVERGVTVARGNRTPAGRKFNRYALVAA